MLTSRNVWKCAFQLTKTWNIAKSRNKEWRQPNIGKKSNDARIITLKSNPSRGTALPAPHGQSWPIMNTISSISLRYRQSFVDIDTSTLWRYRSISSTSLRYRHIFWWYRQYRNDIDNVSSTSILAYCDDIVDIVHIVSISTDFVDIDTIPL